MTTYIALLRAVNVGGRNIVAMADLRELFGGLGFAGARTLLQSGNVVFGGSRANVEALERLLEVETEKRFGVAADYMIRSLDEWDALIAANPFPKEAERAPGYLLTLFLKSAPEAKDVKLLQAAIQGPEVVRLAGKQLYAVYPNGVGRSKLTNTLIEKKLGCRGTGRNWNTVLKLASMAREF